MRARHAAFTLVELLVVISIFAILMSLIFTIAPRAIAKANQTKSLNNMRQIAAGFMLYTNDNNGRFPNRPTDGDGSMRWPSLISEYLKDTKVFVAPDDKSNRGLEPAELLSNGVNHTSYIMNSGMDPGKSDADLVENPIVLAGVEQPSKTIMLGLLFDDTNFFLDVAHDDQGLINDHQFGTSNNYVFMDGSARTIEAKEYRTLNAEKGGNAYLWLLNKDTP